MTTANRRRRLDALEAARPQRQRETQCFQGPNAEAEADAWLAGAPQGTRLAVIVNLSRPGDHDGGDHENNTATA